MAGIEKPDYKKAIDRRIRNHKMGKQVNQDKVATFRTPGQKKTTTVAILQGVPTNNSNPQKDAIARRLQAGRMAGEMRRKVK